MTDFFTRLAERMIGVAPLVRTVSPLLAAGKMMSGGGFLDGLLNGEGEHEIEQAAPTAATSAKSLTGQGSDLPRITLSQGENVRSSPRVIFPAETVRGLTNASEDQSIEVVVRQQQERIHFREGEGDEAPLHSDSIMRSQTSRPSPVCRRRTSDLSMALREIPQSADSTGDRHDKPGGEAPQEHVRNNHHFKPSDEGDLPTHHYEEAPKYETMPLKVVISRHDTSQDESEKSFKIRDMGNDAASAGFGGAIRPTVLAPTAGIEDRRGRLHSEQRLHDKLPTIKVTIGRIDVRAVTQQSAPVIKQLKPQSAALSLDEYLKRRSGGSK